MKKNAFYIMLLLAFFGCNSANEREQELIQQGDELVVKIEEYKKQNEELPNRLKDLGIEETMDGPLFYEKEDSINYIVWFGTGVGEGMYYYSDIKEWDYRLRGMGNDN